MNARTLAHPPTPVETHTAMVGRKNVVSLLDAVKDLSDFCEKCVGEKMPKRKLRLVLQKLLHARAALMNDLHDDEMASTL